VRLTEHAQNDVFDVRVTVDGRAALGLGRLLTFKVGRIRVELVGGANGEDLLLQHGDFIAGSIEEHHHIAN